jgi:hypothetical protein
LFVPRIPRVEDQEQPDPPEKRPEEQAEESTHDLHDDECTSRPCFGVGDGGARREFVEREAVGALAVARPPRREPRSLPAAVRILLAAATVAFQRGRDLSGPPFRISSAALGVVAPSAYAPILTVPRTIPRGVPGRVVREQTSDFMERKNRSTERLFALRLEGKRRIRDSNPRRRQEASQTPVARVRSLPVAD